LTNDLSILPPCPLARYEPSEYIYTEIEGTGEAFGGAAGRIIPRPRTPRSYKEGVGVGGRGQYCAFVRARCRGKRASCSIAGVVKEAFNSRWVTWIRALKGLGIRSTDRHITGASYQLSGKVSSHKALRLYVIIA
jgi:hypothetical protein